MSLLGPLRGAWEGIRPHMLPSLVILGAQKAGTTSLYHMLRQHPKVAPSNKKEVDFFGDDEEYAKGMGYYRSHFPAVPVKVRGFITFEASPSYLFHSASAAPRIAKDLPNAFLLAMLRDPVKRAYSAWNMNRDFKHSTVHSLLHDPRTFAQAVEDELAGRTPVKRHCYLSRSLYADQIADFKKVVSPEKLLIHSFLELKREPVAFMNSLCDTLQLSPYPADHEAFRVKANARSYPEPLDPVLAQELYQYFVPEMEKLRKVLGYDIQIMEA